MLISLFYFYRNHCLDSILKDEFIELSKNSWNEKYGFITVEKTSKNNYGDFENS